MLLYLETWLGIFHSLGCNLPVTSLLDLKYISTVILCQTILFISLMTLIIVYNCFGLFV